MDLGLDGKVCVVTGASRGIGLETARRLAAEGARVLIVARDEAALRAAADEAGADWLAADVTEPDVDERIVADLRGADGRHRRARQQRGDELRARPLDELTDDDWQGQWELHVMAPMRLMRAAAPRMAERGGGRIVNVCSSAGKRPSQTNAAYSVTKAAQLSLSRVFADAYAADNVLVNAVAPGPGRLGAVDGRGRPRRPDRPGAGHHAARRRSQAPGGEGAARALRRAGRDRRRRGLPVLASARAT